MAARSGSTVANLGTRLVQLLEGRRQSGESLLTLAELGELADAGVSVDQVVSATSRKPFSERAVVAHKKDPASLVALREDLDQLADDPLLLQMALTTVCTASSPTCPVESVAQKARLDPALKKPLTQALHRRIADNTLPEGVRSLEVRKKLHVYLSHIPPPPPPKKPEVVLCERLLASLADLRQQGDQNYPTTLRALIASVGPTEGAVLKKTLGSATFKTGIILAIARHPDPPVALAEDRDRLAGSAQVLEFLLRSARTEASQVATAAELQKKLAPALKAPFAESLRRRVATETLPPSVGWLMQKKAPLFFFVQDLHQGVRPAAAVPSTPLPLPQGEKTSENFEARFEAAFVRLDQAHGGHNFVSLVDLRPQIPVGRADFDEGLNRLRLAGRFTLSAAEGRHGLSDAEQEAALREEGALLLYVSRRPS